MPGNEKKGADDGQDPDPAPYLFLTFQVNTDLSLVHTRSILSPDWLQMKREDMTKAYDAKKSCWIPDTAEGFLLGEIVSSRGDTAEVRVGTEVTTYG